MQIESIKTDDLIPYEKNSKREFSDEHRRKLSESHKGYKMPESQKNNISKALKGKSKSKEHNIKVGLANKGKMRSKESRKKQSESRFKHGITVDGYKRVYQNGERVLEHHLVWLQQSDWSFIPEGFVVHHINGNKIDNRIENLACIPKSYHNFLHGTINEFWVKA